MALLVDALNKADRDRRLVGLTLEELPEVSSPEQPPPVPPSAPLQGGVPPIQPPKLGATSAAYTLKPPATGSSFRGAWVLLALILVSLSVAGLYWWIAPTSGLSLTQPVTAVPRPSNGLNAVAAANNPQAHEQVAAAIRQEAFAEPTPPASQVTATSIAATMPPARIVAAAQSNDAFTESKITVHKSSRIAENNPTNGTLRRTITTAFHGGTPLVEALVHLQNHRYAEADALYEKVLRLDPNNIEAMQNRGVIAYNLGRYDEAQQWMQKILAVKPNHAFAKQVLQALSTDRLGSSSAIESVLSQDDEASSASKHFIHGNRLAEQGLWVEAQNQFFLAWQAQADNPDYAYNLAVALDRLGDGQSAIQFYQRAMANSRLPQVTPFQFLIPVAEKRLRELTGVTLPSSR